MKNVDYFYRVHVKLDDNDSMSHLSFDFNNQSTAISIATTLFKACDILKVWVEIVENEIDTTNSPMWRWNEEH